jgi:hypothetical protein
MDDGIGTIVRGRVRPRNRIWALAGGLPALLLVLAGCGATGFNTGALTKDIKTQLDQHPGWAVRSVSCPAHARKAKGVVVRCSATLRSGHVVHLRATELDSKGSIHLVANELFADNVERGIVTALPGTATTPRAVCPNHVPVVIGRAFTCTLTRAGPYTRARVTIVDGDGGFRLTFS